MVSAVARVGAVAGCCLALAHCGQVSGSLDPKYGVSASRRVVQPGEPVPKGGGTYRVGKPYAVAGRTYTPEENTDYRAEGTASWYGEDFHGRQTANGEIYDMNSVSAAHPTLPIPSYVRITNLGNKRSIVARVNDRGPFHQGRVIDVSVRTAKLLGFYENGVARVRVEYVGRAALEGSDDSKLAATLRRGGPAPATPEVRVASNGRFQRQYFDPTPAVPPSHERSFGNARDETPERAARPTRAASVAAVTREPIADAAVRANPVRSPASARSAAVTAKSTSFEARFAPAAKAQSASGRVEPVTAYAPQAPSSAGWAVGSGRGLY